MKIVGVSFDSPSANQAWAEDEGFAFDLWTDANRTLALTYGAADSADEAYASRVTRILDADGVLIVEYDRVVVGTSPAQVLEDCQLLFGQ